MEFNLTIKKESRKIKTEKNRISEVKAKKNPEPELFSEGWGVAGVDTYTGLFGEQTTTTKIFF